MKWAGAVAGVALLSACGETAPGMPAPLVATIVVEAGGEASRQLTGEVRARVDSALGFRVGGQIVERVVQRGQQVRRGQLLARLDSADVALGAAEAGAQAVAAERAVAAARAAATRAVADEKRLAGLVGAGGISDQAFEQAKATADASTANLAAADARLAAARAAARRAANQQQYATLVADADGLVAELLAEPGQVVQPGEPIVRLARAGGRDAVVAVPEAMRRSLPRQATATLYGDTRRFAATLREISGAADPATRSFEARYALAGGEAVPPGSTVTLALGAGQSGTRAAMVAVPLGALIDRGRGANVWIVGRDNSVSLRPVQIAAIRDESALLAGGVRVGERVVALGAHMLSPGQRIRVGGLPQ